MRSPNKDMQLNAHITIKLRIVELEYKVRLRTAICFFLGAILCVFLAFPFDFKISMSTLFLTAAFLNGGLTLYWLNAAQEYKAVYRSLSDEYSRY
jgi:hypothetical protein